MVRSLSWLATVLLVLVVVIADSPSPAQDRDRGGRRGGERFGQAGRGGFGGGGRRGGGGVDAGRLLRNEKVQTELKLDEDQRGELAKLAEEAIDSVREMFSGFRDLSDAERQEKMEEMRTKRQELQADMRKKLEAVLNTDQVKRLDEITLQVRGIGALADKQYMGKLSITDQQKQGIEDVVEAQRDMQRELFGSFRDLRDLDPDEQQEKMAEMRKKGEEISTETEAAVLELLTAEQRTNFEELKGEPFELDRRELFGGGRGGPGGQRGRGRQRDRRGGDGERGSNRPRRPESI